MTTVLAVRISGPSDDLLHKPDIYLFAAKDEQYQESRGIFLLALYDSEGFEKKKKLGLVHDVKVVWKRLCRRVEISEKHLEPVRYW
jgi:hypothetical protein